MPRTASHSKPAAIALQTAAAMIAFAANSLLCRIALAGDLIDAPSFATLRIASGAVLLAWLVRRSGRTNPAPTDWVAAVSLVVYLLPFTLAYLTLDAGSGALLLFGAAQLTMLAAGLYRGERPSSLGWIGLVAAAIGFVSLLAPGAGAPPLLGGGLMTLAGVAWGVYSLRGRRSDDPVASTARSFLFALPWVLVINLAFASQVHSTAAGAALALASGILASALGYVHLVCDAAIFVGDHGRLGAVVGPVDRRGRRSSSARGAADPPAGRLRGRDSRRHRARERATHVRGPAGLA